MITLPYPARQDVLNDAIDSVQRGDRARLLGPADTAWAVEAARKGRAWARRYGLDQEDVTVLVRHIVPNSYRYAPAATNLSLRDGVWNIERGLAQKRAHGRGDEYVVRVKVPSGFGSVAAITKRSMVQRYHGGFAYLRT